MIVSKLISSDNFNSGVADGTYKILDSQIADVETKRSKEYKYFKVEHNKSGLYKSIIFVAVY